MENINIDNIRRGDKSEFRRLFQVAYPQMMAFACRFVSEEVAEDMVQDVFVMYWEKRASMSPDSIRSFLFKCTQNQCLNFLKHHNVVRDWEDNVRLAEERVAFNQEASDDCESWDNLVDRDVEQQLKLAFQKLPPKCRQAFELSYFQEMTYREVAEKMNISPRTVEEHVQKATNLLRNDLRYLLYSTLLAILH